MEEGEGGRGLMEGGGKKGIVEGKGGRRLKRRVWEKGA